MNTCKAIKTVCVVAGVTVMAAMASALPYSNDAQIVIDRALNSPTLTVKYSGANAALVELRVNGESQGTRSVSSAKAAGETTFSLDLNALKDGDNEVEIRLFDRTGKLVGSDKTNISTEQSAKGPVYLTSPKVGATVLGPVEISVGFGRELKNSYVSFFVDSNFKAMTNYPPYTYVWDSAREKNGWHEVEAWAIDESSNKYQTKKIRVFVNNPGGRTDRTGVETELVPTKNPSHASLVGSEAGTRGVISAKAGASGFVANPVAPSAVPVGVGSPVRAGVVATPMQLKPATGGSVIATGVRDMTPTGNRVAKVAPKPVANVGIIEIKTSRPVATVVPTPKTQVLNTVNAASSMIRIQVGTRLPNLGSFAVVMNSTFVNFDVPTRVDNGVPMTPFRHLFEKAGGKVEWEAMSKSVKANAEGHNVFLAIGDATAKVNDLSIRMETAPYIDRGRTIVPLSFLHDALNVNVDYDKATGHVLITSTK